MGVITEYIIFKVIRTDDIIQGHVEGNNSYEGQTVARHTFNEMIGRRGAKKFCS